MNLQKRCGERLHRIRHETGDEGEHENPDRAVEAARQADPGPKIGDADHQSRDRHRQRCDEIDRAARGRVAAMDGVSDGKGDDAAHDGGHQADLHRVPDGAHGERVIEDGVEMHERVVPQIEQASGIGNEQEAAESGHDQSERGQHHDGEEIEQRQGKGEPTPRSKLDDAWAERLSGDGREAAAGEHALLQQHQCAGHRHEDDRDGGGRAVERRRPVGQLENVGGQHGDVTRRAEHRRNAVDAEHHDEGEQHSGDDRRRDQRERDGEEGTYRAHASDLRRFLKARIHVSQRRGREHVDVGGVIHAEHHDQSGHGVKVDAPRNAGPSHHGVDQPGFRRAEDRPGDARDQRRHEQRD